MAPDKTMDTDSTQVSISLAVAVKTYSCSARFHTVNRIGNEAARRHARPEQKALYEHESEAIQEEYT